MNGMGKGSESTRVRHRRSFSMAAKASMVLRAQEMRELGQSATMIAKALGVSAQSLERWSALSESKSATRQTMLPVAVVNASEQKVDALAVIRLRDGTEVHGLSVEQMATLLMTLTRC